MRVDRCSGDSQRGVGCPGAGSSRPRASCPAGRRDPSIDSVVRIVGRRRRPLVVDSVTGRLVARLDYRMQYFIARLARRVADVPAAATDAENIFHCHLFSDVEIPPVFFFNMTAYLDPSTKLQLLRWLYILMSIYCAPTSSGRSLFVFLLLTVASPLFSSRRDLGCLKEYFHYGSAAIVNDSER